MNWCSEYIITNLGSHHNPPIIKKSEIIKKYTIIWKFLKNGLELWKLNSLVWIW